MMDIIALVKPAPFISKQVAEGSYYYLNLRPDPASAGTVVCGGVERCAPDYRVARRRFAYHSVEYVAAGEGALLVNGRRFPLRAGALFYYGPATPHEIVTDPARPLLKYFVDFCGGRFVRLLKRHPLAGHEPRYPADAARVRDLLDRLQQAGRDAGPHTPAICACLLELLLLHAAASAAAPEDTREAARQTYRRCREVIERRYLELRALADVAEACNINAPYLCRLFRRFGAESPYGLLVRLKMRHAADRLCGSPALIKQAAREAGFEDPYHFSRVFKRVYGVAPRDFLRAAGRAAGA